MRALLPLLFLIACDSPSPAVARWNRATVEVSGMTFGVHWDGARAEAYRTSRHAFPNHRSVYDRARLAIERASGCRVRELGGDIAIVTARLDCPGGGATRPSVTVEPGGCQPAGVWTGAAEAEVTVLDCDLIVTTR